MFAHGYHDKEYRSLLRSVTLSPPSKWLSMAPKATQPTAMKKVHKPAKAMQKNKAKVHKVQKKPSQAQTQESFSEMGDVIEEDQEEEQHEEQQHEQEGECQEHEDETAEKDKSKVSGKEYYRFWKKCPRRPRLCKNKCRKSRTSPTGLANRSNWPKWPKPMPAKSGTTNFSSPLNHCSRRGPKQGKTL